MKTTERLHGVIDMTNQKLIAAITSAIANNSSTETVKSLIHDKEGITVEFADGTSYRIIVSPMVGLNEANLENVLRALLRK